MTCLLYTSKEFFKNDHPIVLELGCGRGEYTVGLGKMFPEKNFIAVDIKAVSYTHLVGKLHMTKACIFRTIAFVSA